MVGRAGCGLRHDHPEPEAATVAWDVAEIHLCLARLRSVLGTEDAEHFEEVTILKERAQKLSEQLSLMHGLRELDLDQFEAGKANDREIARMVHRMDHLHEIAVRVNL